MQQRVPENGRDKNWKKKTGVTKKVQLHHIGQSNPLGRLLRKLISSTMSNLSRPVDLSDMADIASWGSRPLLNLWYKTKRDWAGRTVGRA
jgi:hypothetical protein